MRVVIDTNVLVAAVRSKTGASKKLIDLLPSDKFEPAMSVSLYLEYLDVMTREENIPSGVTEKRWFSSSAKSFLIRTNRAYT